jgi:tetratricopeptide (TPR) repeat protein
MKKVIMIVLVFIISCSSNKKLSEVYYKKGYSFYNKGSYIKADKFLQKSIKADRKNNKALYLLLKMHYKEKNDSVFKNLISERIDSINNVKILRIYIRWLIEKKNLNLANNIIEKLLLISPQDPGGLYYKGIIFLSENKYEEALELYYSSFENYLYLIEIHKEVGLIYEKLGLESRIKKHNRIESLMTGMIKNNEK